MLLHIAAFQLLARESRNGLAHAQGAGSKL